MKKALIILFFMFLFFASVKNTYAQSCSFGEVTSPGEFKDYISIQWTHSSTFPLTSVDRYLVKTCNDIECFSFTWYPKGTKSALITGLPRGQYTVYVHSYDVSGNQIDNNPTAYGCDADSRLFSEIQSTVTDCGDGIVGHFEQCDGTNLNGKSCTSFTGYEGGTLACNPNTCQFDKNSCQYCNVFDPSALTTTINNPNNVVVSGSHFSCEIKPNRIQTSPAIACAMNTPTQLSRAAIPPTTGMTSCTFQSWNSDKAIFDCIAPTVSSETIYYANGIFPAKNDPNSSRSVDISSFCGPALIAGDPKLVRVVPATTTLPTVKVFETNTLPSATVDDFRNVRIGISCDTTTSNVNIGCNPSSFKLQKFTTKPTACPTDSTQYGLTSPFANSSSATVWYCATAVDNIGNRGFSTPLEVKPGCRDQCSSYRDRACMNSNPATQYVYVCLPSSNSACMEWQRQDSTSCRIDFVGNPAAPQCTTAGDTGRCTQPIPLDPCSSSTTYIPGDVGPAGIVVDQDGKGIPNVVISGDGRTYGRTLGSGFFSSFTPTTEKTCGGGRKADRPFYGSVNVALKQQDLPKGYELKETKCIWNKKVDDVCRPQPNSAQPNGSCEVQVPFLSSNYDGCAVPTIQFILEKKNGFPNPVPADITITTPDSVESGVPETMTAHVVNAWNTNTVTIYANGAVAGRCTFLSNQGQNLDCTVSHAFPATPNPAVIYAEVKNIDGTTITSATKTIPVLSATAQGSCANLGSSRAEGLVSAPSVTGDFNTTAGCVVDDKSRFLLAKVPKYDDLKKIYFTDSKQGKSIIEQNDFDTKISLGSSDKIYLVKHNLTINSPSDVTGNKTGVVFVDGDLIFDSGLPNNKFTHSNSDSVGIVFVVKEDVVIDPLVIQIDAVIIAEGKIYTAGAGCTESSVPTTNALTINGSLISIHPGNEDNSLVNPIIFCRRLSNNPTNTRPSETINHQMKYVSILRNLFSDTYQKWSEVSN